MNRLEVVGYLYHDNAYCTACMTEDVDPEEVKSLYRSSRHVNGYTCYLCCDTLVDENDDLKTFEVRIVYKGQRNYIIKAVDEDKANVQAMDRYRTGDNGDSTGGEYEEVENIVTREVQC